MWLHTWATGIRPSSAEVLSWVQKLVMEWCERSDQVFQAVCPIICQHAASQLMAHLIELLGLIKLSDRTLITDSSHG